MLFVRGQLYVLTVLRKKLRKKNTKSAPHKGKKDAKKLEFFCKTQVL